MDPDQIYLFHSRLSFAMNSKLLHPLEVIEKVVDHWRANKDDIDISQVEGFVRQILGWREYMRGIYWMKMPGYRRSNKLDNQNELPDFYWTAETKMNCMHHAIKQSLDHAYAQSRAIFTTSITDAFLYCDICTGLSCRSNTLWSQNVSPNYLIMSMHTHTHCMCIVFVHICI